MRLPEEPEQPFQINIVPMIDVVFALLTFFIMSTLFLTRSEGLSVNLPRAATGQMQQSAPLTVTVNAQGQLALNRQTIDLRNLQARVRSLVRPNTPTLVIINADERVSHGQVVAVMDQLRAIRGVRLAIATQRPQ